MFDLNKLLSGKWIATVLIVGTYCLLAIDSKIPIESFNTVVAVVIWAYFNKRPEDPKH